MSTRTTASRRARTATGNTPLVAGNLYAGPPL